MSEYFFGVGNGRVKREAAKRIAAIAKRHGATFLNPTLPEGPRYWFAGPNLGFPFDRALSRAVQEDLQAAGLADATGALLPSTKVTL